MIVSEDMDGPFGLTDEEVRRAFERTQARPAGRPRYAAFARELERAAVERWSGKTFLALPLAHAYGRLLVRAHGLRDHLSGALQAISRGLPGVDVRPGFVQLKGFDSEFSGAPRS